MTINILHLLWIVPLAMAAGAGVLFAVLGCIAVCEESVNGY